MSDTRYLNVAEMIGARLCRDAIWSGNRCNWLGDSMEYAESRWQVVRRSFGPDLYNGTTGIGLFLSNLFAMTRDRIVKKTAEAAIHCAIAQLDGINHDNFGFYSGRTGIAFVLMEAARLLENDQFRAKSKEVLGTIPAGNISFQSWDVISGSAGVIPVLLKLHAQAGDNRLLDLAFRHGEMLLEGANRGSDGWSWKTIPPERPDQKDLTGFSHGTAGIAWALLELSVKSQERRFLEGVEGAMSYERRWYDAGQENWPDFRSATTTGPPVCGMAWCHGAPGIGLARLRMYQLLKDPLCRNEAEIATRSTARALHASMYGGQGNYSLCHGNLGNAELLLHAHEVLEDAGTMQTVHEMADQAAIAHQVARTPWPCGVLNGGETPNLMLGLAGIGYFYLRLFDSRQVPSVMIVGP
jgi:type 2 lantibiotic biosynthesis protein LanM